MASDSDSDSTQNRLITLRTLDKSEFVVEERVARVSGTIKNLIKDLDADFVPIGNISGPSLAQIVEYCKKHSSTEPVTEQDPKSFDSAFVEKDLKTLFDLVLGAHYLAIHSLVDLLCVKIADCIKDLPHQEVRKIFNVDNDYTQEEELAKRNEFAWAFEGYP